MREYDTFSLRVGGVELREAVRPDEIYEGLTPEQAAQVDFDLLIFGRAVVERDPDGSRRVLSPETSVRVPVFLHERDPPTF